MLPILTKNFASILLVLFPDGGIRSDHPEHGSRPRLYGRAGRGPRPPPMGAGHFRIAALRAQTADRHGSPEVSETEN